jgi:hypothetical protein
LRTRIAPREPRAAPLGRFADDERAGADPRDARRAAGGGSGWRQIGQLATKRL